MVKAFRLLAKLFYMAGDALERMADRWPETRERLEDAAIDLSLDLEDAARDAARAARRAAGITASFVRYLARAMARTSLQVVLAGHRAYKIIRSLLPVLADYLRHMQAGRLELAGGPAGGMT